MLEEENLMALEWMVFGMIVGFWILSSNRHAKTIVRLLQRH
jgi:hypothetical protein